MFTSSLIQPARLLPLSLLLLATTLSVPAAFAGAITKLTIDENAPVVTLFDGIDQGLFEVRVSARDAFKASVFITNNANKSMTVELPKAVAAAHILKQFDDGIFDLDNNSSNQGSGQETAGQMTPFGSGTNAFPQQNQNGANFFSIPPEKTVRIQLQSVCLEHGKPSPHPKLTYVLRRLETQVANPVLRELLTTFDPEKADRQAVQAAAWHLSNSMSWKELKNKKHRHIGLPSKLYFTSKQIESAKKLVEQAEKAVEKQTTEQKLVADKKL